MPPKSNMPKRHNFYCIVYLTFGQYAIRSLSIPKKTFVIHLDKKIEKKIIARSSHNNFFISRLSQVSSILFL